MFKLAFLSVLLTATVMGNNVDQYIGQVTPIAVFPQVPSSPTTCQSYTIAKIQNGKCTCGDRTDLPLFEFQVAVPKMSSQFTPIVVSSSSEVAAVLVPPKMCDCGVNYNAERTVVRLINDNFILQYEAPHGKMASNEPNMAILYAKTVPKKSEVEALIKTIDDLSNRSYSLMCDSASFAPEN